MLKPYSPQVKHHLKLYRKKLSNKTDNKRFVMDGRAGSKFAHIMLDCSPCITRCRGSSHGHFVTKLNRFMQVEEIGRLQGFSQEAIEAYTQAEPNSSKLGAAFGDSMSINVLMRLIPKVLHSAGLAEPGKDIWEASTNLLGSTPGRNMPDELYNRANFLRGV